MSDEQEATGEFSYPYGTPGHCFDIDEFNYHEPGQCPECQEKRCCGYMTPREVNLVVLWPTLPAPGEVSIQPPDKNVETNDD